jgi:hypothetical protein
MIGVVGGRATPASPLRIAHVGAAPASPAASTAIQFRNAALTYLTIALP